MLWVIVKEFWVLASCRWFGSLSLVHDTGWRFRQYLDQGFGEKNEMEMKKEELEDRITWDHWIIYLFSSPNTWSEQSLWVRILNCHVFILVHVISLYDHESLGLSMNRIQMRTAKFRVIKALPWGLLTGGKFHLLYLIKIPETVYNHFVLEQSNKILLQHWA